MDRSNLKYPRKHSNSARIENQLRLTGSQVSLVARSHQSGLRSPISPTSVRKMRPSSAVSSFDKSITFRPNWKRPMSADNDNLNQRRLGRATYMTARVDYSNDDEKLEERVETLRSSYTVSSSRLLRSLLGKPWDSEASDTNSNDSDSNQSEKSLGRRIQEMAQSQEDAQRPGAVADFKDTDSELSRLESKCSGDTESTLCLRDIGEGQKVIVRSKDEILDMKFQRWFQSERPTKPEEKVVRFVESPEKCKAQIEYESEEEETVVELTSRKMNSPEPMKEEEEEDNKGREESPSLIDFSDAVEQPTKQVAAETEDWRGSSSCPFACCHVPVKETAMTAQPEAKSAGVQTPRDTTYDDIVSILHVLEQEEADSMLDPIQDDMVLEKVMPAVVSSNDSQLRDIMSYLDEVERCSDQVIDTAKHGIESVRHKTTAVKDCVIVPNSDSLPRLEELLNKNTVELSHEVLCLRLQVEDQKGGIHLLQQTIAEMKEAAKVAEVEQQDAICKMTTEAEAAVQRHQKFIKQLLSEKKSLNDKVSTLVEDLRASEDRYQRNIKAIEERHLIEIQRVKETQSVAEKLKREKWIDTKTQKIKEMTVKGLEPELSRMAARQQQELTELRNLHRAEIEAVELRNTRRTAELLDQLRTDLTKEKEEALQRETTAVRERMEKQLEEERNNLHHEARRLREQVRRERERLGNAEAQMQETLAEARRSFERDRERDRQRLQQEAQERAEHTERRHQGELKALKETLEIEKETWMTNFKKQQTTKFLEREAELHHQYKRERDRDIELIIERLENEATQARLELTQTSESKLKRLKEKMEAELKEAEANEQHLKNKLTEVKTQLSERDDTIVDLSSQCRHFHMEMSQLKKLCEEMAADRADLKEIIRREFEQQLAEAVKDMEAVRNEMTALRTMHAVELAKREQLAIQDRADAQRELQQVYSRVKLTVSKKDEALEALREQHRAALERCSHLEKMLENQRRNLLLK